MSHHHAIIKCQKNWQLLERNSKAHMNAQLGRADSSWHESEFREDMVTKEAPSSSPPLPPNLPNQLKLAQISMFSPLSLWILVAEGSGGLLCFFHWPPSQRTLICGFPCYMESSLWSQKRFRASWSFRRLCSFLVLSTWSEGRLETQ